MGTVVNLSIKQRCLGTCSEHVGLMMCPQHSQTMINGKSDNSNIKYNNLSNDNSCILTIRIAEVTFKIEVIMAVMIVAIDKTVLTYFDCYHSNISGLMLLPFPFMGPLCSECFRIAVLVHVAMTVRCLVLIGTIVTPVRSCRCFFPLMGALRCLVGPSLQTAISNSHTNPNGNDSVKHDRNKYCYLLL